MNNAVIEQEAFYSSSSDTSPLVQEGKDLKIYSVTVHPSQHHLLVLATSIGVVVLEMYRLPVTEKCLSFVFIFILTITPSICVYLDICIVWFSDWSPSVMEELQIDQ